MALRPAFHETHISVIVSFLRRHFEDSRRRGVVLGMSGGLDSSLVAKLSADAVGPSNVLGLSMPVVAAGSQNENETREWARQLGIGFRTTEIGPMVETVTDQLKIPRDDRIGTGNVHARVRMITLYQAAHAEERIVIGAGNKSELLTGYFCYDSETRAMTPGGPRLYWELRAGDTVFSMDLKTRKVVEVPVEAVHVFPYEGEMVEISGNLLNLLVTPNHRMLISRNRGQGPLGFETAESRFNGGTTRLPTAEPWDGVSEGPRVIDCEAFLQSTPPAQDAHSPLQMAIEDFLYLMGIFIGDGANEGRQIAVSTKPMLAPAERLRFRLHDGRSAPVPDDLIPMKADDGPLMLITAGDGNRTRESSLEILERYEAIMRQTPILVALTDGPLSAAFAECGGRGRNRHIPPWVMKLPARQLGHLYRGIMDGHGNTDGSAYTTSSPRLAYQMVELCMKLGLHAWLRQRPLMTTTKRGKIIPSGRSYEVRIEGRTDTLTFTPRNMRRVSYRGKVWCPSVPPHENLLVERHGRMVFCGNTKFGDAGCDFLPIGDLYKTQVREMARYLGVPKMIIEKVPSAGLWEGQTDEEELGLPYEDLDQVLLGLELQISLEEIVSRTRLSADTVRMVAEMVRRSVHKRKMPLIPKVGIRTVGLDWRE
ncbi:MAG: NAD(+) synthase [Thermoplasmata archaeon]